MEEKKNEELELQEDNEPKKKYSFPLVLGIIIAVLLVLIFALVFIISFM